MATDSTSRRLHLFIAAATASAGLVALGPPAAAIGETCLGEEATIVGSGDLVGTPDHDVIVGSEGPDSIAGGGGGDVICGLGGSDLIHGEDGDDLIDAGAGDDEAWGDEGTDVIELRDGVNQGLGGPGGDSIFGGAGVDTIFGHEGNDDIEGYGGNDEIHGGEDEDLVIDGYGKDKVYLDEGDDTLLMQTLKDPNDVIDGGPGTDTADYSIRTTLVKLNLSNTTADDGAVAEYDRLLAIENAIGGSANDTIIGTTGSNFLAGGPGDDTISDLAGADEVDGGPGKDKVIQGSARDVDDVLDGGSDIDTISYATRTINVTNTIDMDSSVGLVGGSGQQNENDALFGFENAIGGASPDSIYGTDGPNVINAGNGYNGVQAFAGDDTITTGTSDDLVYDGPGADRVVTGGGCDRVLQLEFGEDLVETNGSSTDYLDGGTGTCDKIDYGDRTDDLSINLGVTTNVNGGAGEADVLKGFERATGGYGDDTIRGNGAANLLVGGYGDFDNVDDGADTLFGMGGADILVTYDEVEGNDSADGGFGSDKATIDPGDATISIEALTVF